MSVGTLTAAQIGMRPARVGAILWVCCLQFFIAEQIVRFFVRGSYSMSRNMISDLGAVHCPGAEGVVQTLGCSPLHGLMNASFALQGLLIACGAVLVRRLFPSKTLATAAFAAFVLSGLGLLAVGLAPEDTAGDLHVLGATTHFVCGGLALILLGMALLRRSSERAGTASVGAGMLVLAATGVLGASQAANWSSLGWPEGAVERVAAYPLPLWLSVTGFVLLRRMRRAADV